MWKTHNGGKNHDSSQAVKYTIREEYRIKENTEATTSCLLLHHTRRRLHGGGNDLSLSLSLSLFLSHTLCTTFQSNLYNNTENMCPKVIFIHIWLFGIFTSLSFQSVGTDRAGFVMSRFSASSIRRDMFPNIEFPILGCLSPLSLTTCHLEHFFVSLYWGDSTTEVRYFKLSM